MRLAHVRDRTVLAELRHRGPLRVQRPFYPQADDSCHIYLLHPPGGVVGGDALSIEADVTEDARVLVTTPAAGKFYRSEQRWATQRQRFRVAPRASLEWLPQENIFFSGAWARSQTRVELHGDAAFLGWEITALGRPASAEPFAHGRCEQSFEIWRDGAPLWLERGSYAGGDDVHAEEWGLGGNTAIGVLACVGPAAALTALVRPMRERLDQVAPGGRHAVTLLGDVVVCRALGSTTENVRLRLSTLWTILRAGTLGRAAIAPRVWAT